VASYHAIATNKTKQNDNPVKSRFKKSDNFPLSYPFFLAKADMLICKKQIFSKADMQKPDIQ
jgi:hypothetical protein